MKLTLEKMQFRQPTIITDETERLCLEKMYETLFSECLFRETGCLERFGFRFPSPRPVWLLNDYATEYRRLLDEKDETERQLVIDGLKSNERRYATEKQLVKARDEKRTTEHNSRQEEYNTLFAKLNQTEGRKAEYAVNNFRIIINRIKEGDATQADIYKLSYMVALSVCRKIYEKSGNIHILNMYHDIQNKTGDGFDLVHVAYIAIRDNIEKHGTDMERVWTKRVLDKHVVIREENSAKWKEKETNSIREVFLSVRRYISANSAIQAVGSKYSYIEDVIRDKDENGMEVLERIYKRTFKFYQGDATETDMKDEKQLIDCLSLTDKQATVLKYRLSGYGEKAIASCLGVSKTAIQKTLKQIRVKWIAVYGDWGIDTVK